jgi:hypothetical protein
VKALHDWFFLGISQAFPLADQLSGFKLISARDSLSLAGLRSRSPGKLGSPTREAEEIDYLVDMSLWNTNNKVEVMQQRLSQIDWCSVDA